MESCQECGLDLGNAATGSIIEVVASAGKRFTAPLTRFLRDEDGDALVRIRPEPSVWSALEYAAHTRDALGFYRERIQRVCDEDRPHLPLPAVGFEAACEERGYNREDRAAALDGLIAEAGQLTALLESLSGEQWDKVGIGSTGDERSVLVLARRAAHECHHHLLDVGRGLRRVREALADRYE